MIACWLRQMCRMIRLGAGHAATSWPTNADARAAPGMSIRKGQPMSDLAAALVALQGDLPKIGKNAEGQRSKYADLPNVSRILLPRLAALGLFFSCRPTMHDQHGFVLAYELTHTGGETRQGFYPLPNNTPQTIGGSITYARRYALLAVTGVAPDEDDDDAQAAEQEARELSRRPPETRPDGSATFAEQERMLHDRAGWTQEAPQRPERTEWDAEPSTGYPRTSALRAMFALYRELGIQSKEPMVDDIAMITGHPVASRGDLSLEEITAVNGVLRKRRDAKRAAESVTT